MAEKRKRAMSDAAVVKFLQDELSQSEGYDDDELSAEREQALDYYYARKRGDEVTGRSQVQSMDVADMLEAVMSEIMPGVENDDLCVFRPTGAQDFEQAALESEAVNDMIMNSNDGYMLFEQAFHNALLMRNGWAKVGVEETVEKQTQKFIGITPEGSQELVTADDPNVEIVVASSEINADNSELLDVTATITRTDYKLMVEPADNTNIYYRKGHKSIEVDGIPFIAERDMPSRSDLIRQGHREADVYALPAYTLDTKSDSTSTTITGQSEDKETTDPSLVEVERFTCWAMMDKQATGIAELYECEMVGDTLLSCEPVPMNPFSTGSALPQPLRVAGLSLFDKLKHIQDIKTKGVRNWLDNQELVNYGRMSYDEQTVNLDDLMNQRPNGVVARGASPDAVTPIVTPDQGGSIQTLLDYADKMRSERGGAALDLQNAQAQIAGETAWGVERQYSAREKLAGRMSRNLAKTLVKQVFLKVHRTMRTSLRGSYTFQRGEDFVSVNPTEWQERDAVIVKTGMTMSEQNRQLNTLREIYAEQKAMIGGGYEGIITDEQRTFNCLMDMNRLAGVTDPHRYWINPTSEGAKQAKQAKADQAKQAQEQQQAMTMQLANIQRDIEQSKNRVDVFEARLKAFVDLVTAGMSQDEKTASMAVSLLNTVGDTNADTGTG